MLHSVIQFFDYPNDKYLHSQVLMQFLLVGHLKVLKAPEISLEEISFFFKIRNGFILNYLHSELHSCIYRFRKYYFLVIWDL